ncbi:hypothetical protein PIB30_081325 [Stylosanthes scabra]|uniref:Uncharacterized protein n=1 Tax=Stylosanthes scabra TaxID=79078 RepID=A0ABU6QRS3_9FABA|nr:hypothetical protein [Stylosanthes scabra]
MRFGIVDRKPTNNSCLNKTNELKGPKCRGRGQGKLKRTKKQGEWTKSQKRAQLSVDRASASLRWRASALLSLIWKFPLVARPRDPDGAPVPPHFVTPETRTLRARAIRVARSRGDGRTHLNEGYFGDFTFPGHDPSISQAQFDLYGGGTAEAQHTFSHFINFSLSLVLGDFWEKLSSLSFSL